MDQDTTGGTWIIYSPVKSWCFRRSYSDGSIVKKYNEGYTKFYGWYIPI